MNSDDDTPLDSLFTENVNTSAPIPANTRWQKFSDEFYVLKTDKTSLDVLTESQKNLIKVSGEQNLKTFFIKYQVILIFFPSRFDIQDDLSPIIRSILLSTKISHE